MFKQNLAKLLETEMDRKDFLKTLAVAAVTLTGVTALIKTLTNSSILPASTTQQQLGYGDAFYSAKPQASQSDRAYS